ncbi:MAG: hypothetical protein ACREVX_02155 [Clostridium sp.]|uniref:hypothetical protein n=1 Tax=Clostridium sp. TaxID=1506 RepID=UPI003D6C7413
MNLMCEEKEKENGEGKISFVEILNENKNIIRKAIFRILDTTIIYNEEEDFYYTLATCVNENHEIETISIEEFGIYESVVDFKGAFIDYEEYEQNSETKYNGVIYCL